jgi:hypothetical protein
MYKNILFDVDGTLLPMDVHEFVKYYFGSLCEKMIPVLMLTASETAVFMSESSATVGSRPMTNAETALRAKASLLLFDGKLRLISFIKFISAPPIPQARKEQTACTYFRVC